MFFKDLFCYSAAVCPVIPCTSSVLHTFSIHCSKHSGGLALYVFSPIKIILNTHIVVIILSEIWDTSM